LKTLSTFTETAIDNPHVDIIRLVEITIGETTLYLCDRVFGDDGLCVFNNRLYEPLIISWGTIKTGRIDPLTYAVEPGDASFTVDNSQPVGGADCFTALFINNDPQYCSVIISEIHEGASAAEDKEDIFGGHIEDLPEMTVDRVTVACGGFELDIVNKFVHTIVDDTTYPGADPDDIGKMVPQIYGPVKRVPCIAADAGGKTTIAEDMTDTSPGNGETLDISDASAFPSSGAFTIQIDSEQVRIASRSGNTLTLAASGARGYNSTDAVYHDLGAPMAEIQTKYVYLLADHPVKEITTVYVDNIRQISGFTAYSGADYNKIADPSILPTGPGYGVAFNHDGSLMAVAHWYSPYITIYNTSDWSKVANPSVLPAGAGYGVAFNHDGSLMAVAHWDSPYITIYNTSDWSKVANPSVLPAGSGYGLAFNHDGSLLAVAHWDSPYITIYNTSDWSKIANPSVLPAGAGHDVAFNHDGSLMAVAHFSSPYITIYNTSDWSKVANPSVLPPNIGYGVAFNHDGSLMAVAHSVSPYITIYNTSDWSKIADPTTLPSDIGRGVAFNHDGSLMAVVHNGSPYVTIYNTSDWSKIDDPSTLPTSSGNAVAFNHDGSLIAVLHDDSPFITIYELSEYFGKAVIIFDALPNYKKQVNIEADSSDLGVDSSGRATGDSGHSHSSAQQTIEWYFDDATVITGSVQNPNNICDQNLTNYARFCNLNAKCEVEKISSEEYSGPPQQYRICVRVGTVDVGVQIRANFYGLSGTYGCTVTSAHNNSTRYSMWYTVSSAVDTWVELKTKKMTVEQIAGNNYGNINEVWLEVKWTPQGTISGYANVSLSGINLVSGIVTLAGNSTAETVIGKMISADAQGYKDDSAGTITGTPYALIERPDHQAKHIIIDRCGLSADEIHAASYSAAGIFFNANSFTLGFPILQRPNVRLLLNRIAIQAKALEFWEAGKHHIVPIASFFIEDELSVLLLHMDGTDGSTVFIDDGATGHTVIAHGNAQIDTAYKKFGTGSGLFDGSGDYLSIPDHANFNMASGRVAIDVWKRFQSADKTAVLYSQFVDNTHFVKFVVHNDIISFHIKNGSDVVNFSRTYTAGFTAGVQYHIALIRGWNNSDNTWAITVTGQIVGDVYSNSAAWPDLAAEILIGKTGDWSKITNPSVFPPGTGNGIAFNHDGSLVAVAHWYSPYITIYNTSDWSKVSNPSLLPSGTGYGVAFNHDGSLMAVAHNTSPYITIYNTSDWSKVANPVVWPVGISMGVAFNHDGSLMVVAHSGSPRITIYNTSDWSKIADPSTLPAGPGCDVAFNHDGSLMAVAHDTSPYITIYNTSDWSKVTDPTTLPSNIGYGVAFNHDGSLMAVAHDASPYITIYNTSNWSKVTDPSTLPAGAVRGVAFNHDGSLMAVASLYSPYIIIYNTSDWSKVADPSTLPTSSGRGVAFNHDGSLMAVAHNSSPKVTTYVPVQYSKGHKDEYRVSKPTARWTADFTPSNEPYPNTDPGGGMFWSLSVYKTIDDNRVDLGQIWLKYTDRINIKNKLTASYSRQWSGHIDEVEADRAIVITSDAGSITKFGVLQGDPLSFPYVNGETQAQAVLNWKLADSKGSRLIVEQAGGYYLTDIERGDIICFDHMESIGDDNQYLEKALLGLVTMGTTLFRVIDKNYRPDATIQIEAVIII